MQTIFALVVSIILPDAGMAGVIVLDPKFDSRQACEDVADAEVAKAVSFLGRQHGRVVIQRVECKPQDMLKPGADA